MAITTGYNIEQIDQLPTTEFRRAIDMIIHKDNFVRGGELSLLSEADKYLNLMAEHKRFFPHKWN